MRRRWFKNDITKWLVCLLGLYLAYALAGNFGIMAAIIFLMAV